MLRNSDPYALEYEHKNKRCLNEAIEESTNGHQVVGVEGSE